MFPESRQTRKHLTIIRRRRRDYRGIFPDIITEPEANNCFSIFKHKSFVFFGTEFILSINFLI